MSNIGIAGFEMYHKNNKEEFRTPTRKDLAGYFESVFYHKPTAEQLDVFLGYLIGRERDANKVLEICGEQVSEENAKQNI